MAQKILITGITGFAGYYLAKHLLETTNDYIYGTTLTPADKKEIADSEKLHLVQIDLTDPQKVSQAVADIRPDVVYHLAALTSPGESFTAPSETITNNIASQVHILEAVRQAKLTKTKILIISCAEVYGLVDPKDIPTNENAPLRPASPYAVSKIAQDFLGLQYHLSHEMHIVRVRPFNHIGPRQAPRFVIASFAKKIAEIERGNQTVLTVGNLSTRRDFTDVRDMVKAYVLAIEKGESGEVYNLGSQVSYSIEEVLAKLLSYAKKDITVQVDKELFRKGDIQELLCDVSKFTRLTGRKPTISLDQTLKETLDYWRNIV